MIKLNEVSQSKKIGQYVDASVFIRWYKENYSKIANILGVDEDTLPSVTEMLSQSYGLIKNVINPQKWGNRGDRTAFESFEEFDKILIHDFLHNLYNVSEKEFLKNLSQFEFTIDELIEEMEILAIEESFMKYMNIRYPKRDFINQNINQLASYIVATFIKDYPEDFLKIVSGEEEPFLPINGKKMYLKGTPYEGVGVLLRTIPESPDNLGSSYNKDYINNESEFYDFLKRLYVVALTIDYTGGDTAQYPDGDFYGQPDNDDLYDRDNMEYFFDEAGSGDWNVAKWDEYLDLIKESIKEYKENQDEEISDEEIEEYFSGDITYEDFPGLDFSFNNADEVETYDRNGNLYIFYESDSLKPIEANVRDLMEYDEEGFYEYIYEKQREKNYEIEASFYNKTEDISLRDLIEKIMDEDTARRLFRRFFRGTDLIRNISKSTDGKWRTTNYNLNVNNFFEIPYPSLSKNLYTDNAKKLYILLNEFRGYVIKNISSIKARYKQNLQLDQNFLNFFTESNADKVANLSNLNNVNQFIDLVRKTKVKVTLYTKYYTNKKIDGRFYIVMGYSDLKEYYEFIPIFINFLNQYKDTVSKLDDNYLAQFTSIHREKLVYRQPNLKSMFTDEHISKLKILFALLVPAFKKAEKLTNLEKTIEGKLSDIDIFLIQKTLNLKYKNNPPDESYTKLLTNSINEIFTRYFSKPKTIELDKEPYESHPNPSYKLIGYDRGFERIVRFVLTF
jgi:hypothetical protein